MLWSHPIAVRHCASRGCSQVDLSIGCLKHSFQLQCSFPSGCRKCAIPSLLLVNDIPRRLGNLSASHIDRQRVYCAFLRTLLPDLPWIDASYTDIENKL